MAVGSVAKNEYLMGIINAWWHGNEEKVAPDPGKVYFVQLHEQWNQPFAQVDGHKKKTKPLSTKKKRVRFNEP